MRKFLVLSILFGVFVLPAIGCAGESGAVGIFTGRVLLKDGGKPLSGGAVLFYNKNLGPAPNPEQYWRVPDEVSEVDQNGYFSIELKPGEYYITGIKRSDAGKVGPPLEGEAYFVKRSAAGKPELFQVKAGEKKDLGNMAEATPYIRKYETKGISGIEGSIIDEQGQPVPNVFVFAFVDPEVKRFPLFVSDPSDAQGKFLLRVAGSGDYYLKVRDHHGGGRPAPGSMVGAYKAPQQDVVHVDSGKITRGITIAAEKVKSREEMAAGQAKRSPDSQNRPELGQNRP